MCAGDEITVPLSFHYLYSLRSIDNNELRTRQVSNGHRLTNQTRITRFDRRIVDHSSTILIVCTCFFSFFSLFFRKQQRQHCCSPSSRIKLLTIVIISLPPSSSPSTFLEVNKWHSEENALRVRASITN